MLEQPPGRPAHAVMRAIDPYPTTQKISYAIPDHLCPIYFYDAEKTRQNILLNYYGFIYLLILLINIVPGEFVIFCSNYISLPIEL